MLASLAEKSNRIGKYEVLHKLGVGGMAETFIAMAQNPEGISQRVCLKRVLPAFSSEETFVSLFLSEARITASLRHSNIVQLIEFGKADDAFFLALELIEGVDLRGLLRAQPTRMLPYTLVVLIAMDLAQALDYAHTPSPRGQARREGVIHRDISPSNVLLSFAGEVKLTDFGIAKALENKDMTHTTGLKGKVPYMAPEQIKHGRIDARTDLFSLGVTLYEALVGERPFDAATEVQTFHNILNGERPKTRDVCPKDTPEELIQTLDWLLEIDYEKRCPSAAALIDALAPITPPPTKRRELAALVNNLVEPTMQAGPLPQGVVVVEPSPKTAAQPTGTHSHVTASKKNNDAPDFIENFEQPGQSAARHPSQKPTRVEPKGMPTPQREASVRSASPSLESAEVRPDFLRKRLRKGPKIAIAVACFMASITLAAWWSAMQKSASVSPVQTPKNQPTEPAEAERVAPSEAKEPPQAEASPEPSENAAVAPETTPMETDLVNEPPTDAKNASQLPGRDTREQARKRENAAPAQKGALVPEPTHEVVNSKEVFVDEKGGPSSSFALIKIRTVPYGYIWIDGKAAGRSPKDVKLRPGIHRIGTGPDIDRPTGNLTLPVAGGDHRKITINIAP